MSSDSKRLTPPAFYILMIAAYKDILFSGDFTLACSSVYRASDSDEGQYKFIFTSQLYGCVKGTAGLRG